MHNVYIPIFDVIAVNCSLFYAIYIYTHQSTNLNKFKNNYNQLQVIYLNAYCFRLKQSVFNKL